MKRIIFLTTLIGIRDEIIPRLKKLGRVNDDEIAPLRTQIDAILNRIDNAINNPKKLDLPIEIKGEENDLFFNFLKSILTYPNCDKPNCGKPLCRNDLGNVCECPDYEFFREEHKAFEGEITKTVNTIQDLSGSPFRPLRNSYGSGASTFGVSGLTITVGGLVVGVSATAAGIVTAGVAPIAAGVFAYVYKRDAAEEEKALNDLYADAFKNAIFMRFYHVKSVEERLNAISNKHIKIIDGNISDFDGKIRDEKGEMVDENKIKFGPQEYPREPKDKHGIKGNAFSHFLFPALGTIGLLVPVIIKMAPVLFAGLAVSGPVGWALIGAAGLLALGAGSYFAYKRYQFLTKKVACEAQLDELKHNCSLADKFLGKFIEKDRELEKKARERTELENENLKLEIKEWKSKDERSQFKIKWLQSLLKESQLHSKSQPNPGPVVNHGPQPNPVPVQEPGPRRPRYGVLFSPPGQSINKDKTPIHRARSLSMSNRT